MIAVVVVGEVQHSEGVVWRKNAVYSQYEYQMHVKSLDFIVILLRAVEKTLAPVGTRTPVPRLSTLLSIPHCTDGATVAVLRIYTIKGNVFVNAMKACCGMNYSSTRSYPI
jgi:hypothetical protein